MRINEVFHSLQGEGPLTGVRTTFIRTARCNLRCSWCDTTYSFGPGQERSIASLLGEVTRHRTRNVCLTGGEPLLQRESVELVRRLSERGITTVIETGGSLDVGPYLAYPNVVLSVDVKCPSSHMHGRNRWENLPLLRASDVLKFVIGDRTDYAFAKSVLRRYHGPAVGGVPAGLGLERRPARRLGPRGPAGRPGHAPGAQGSLGRHPRTVGRSARRASGARDSLKRGLPPSALSAMSGDPTRSHHSMIGEDFPFGKARGMVFPRIVLVGHGVISDLGSTCHQFGFQKQGVVITGPRTAELAGNRADGHPARSRL